MHIIPVIDLRGGTAVHARRGERRRYRPLNSPLCNSAEPGRVADALLSIYPFPAVYCADLDAIEGTGNNDAVIQALVTAYPEVTFWVDRGDTHAGRPAAGTVPVIGTETGISADGLGRLASAHEDFILSLDFADAGFCGDGSVLADSATWPARIILMSLAHVGAAQGPALGLAAMAAPLCGGRAVYIGGGIRDAADLDAAQAAGCAGALVATALHTGALDRAEIAAYMAG